MDRQLPGDEDRLAPDRRLTNATRRERAALAALAALALLTFSLLALWARYFSPAPGELELLVALGLGSDPFATLVRGINTLGDLPVWIGLVGVASLAVYLARGVAAGVLVALSLIADLIGGVTKVLVERMRPESAIVESLFGADHLAFPSGHVVRAVALAAALAWVLLPPARRLPAAVAAAAMAALVMGYARVALGVHWPTDALGGLLLGLGWFAFTARGMELQPAGRPAE